MCAVLVKLGGSVITDKSSYRCFDQGSADRLAREIASSGERALLVHGAGSFGHVLAAEHRLQKGYLDQGQLAGLSKVQLDVRDLNLMVMRSLDRAGVHGVSLPPGAMGLMEGGELKDLDLGLFRRYLDLGLTPVTFGDVVLDSRRRFGICSGDQLMYLLAKEFRPERIVFCADVDGIFTSDPALEPGARLVEEVDRRTLEDLPRTSRVADVTGSIYAKVEFMLRLAELGQETMVINGRAPGRLEAALKGEKVKGSVVLGGSR
ncbi:MAG: isopentenyl phosphate kinase [Methanomassiliicoccales archaeon]|nr:isopentenyl phosphate kinase [Methanomassiliicoccales archaeon]